MSYGIRSSTPTMDGLQSLAPPPQCQSGGCHARSRYSTMHADCYRSIIYSREIAAFASFLQWIFTRDPCGRIRFDCTAEANCGGQGAPCGPQVNIYPRSATTYHVYSPQTTHPTIFFILNLPQIICLRGRPSPGGGGGQVHRRE